MRTEAVLEDVVSGIVPVLGKVFSELLLISVVVTGLH